jgi:hypothetical protein
MAIKRKVQFSRGNGDELYLYSYPHQNFISAIRRSIVLAQLSYGQQQKIKTLFCPKCTDEGCADEDYCKAVNDEVILIIPELKRKL